MARPTSFPRIATVAVALAALPGPVRASSADQRLVVMTLEASDVSASLAEALNEYLLTEFQEAQRYVVLGGSDVVAMLENEAQKQLVGCDQEDCLTQIAGAMDAQFLAASNVGRLDEGFLFNLKIINVRTATVVSRASIKSDAGDDNLMAAVRTGVRMVTATSTFIDELPRVSVGPIGLWAGAVVALGTGIGFGAKSAGHHRDFLDPTYADVDGAARAGRQSQTIANVAFVASALSASAGLVWWWLFGDRVEIMPGADGATSSAGVSR